MSARPGLYGGQPVMAVPTVINSYSLESSNDIERYERSQRR